MSSASQAQMTTASTETSKLAPSPTVRVLPVLLFFEDERDIRPLLVEIPRYRRLPVENSADLPADAECVLITASERLLSRSYDEARRPMVRVVALSEQRFRDARIDALVYAYLPPNTPPALLERTLDNALDHIHLIHVREQINERLRGVTREISELNQIGAALSAEHHLDRLLELILTKSRHITNADAGSLYLVEAVPDENEEAQPQRAALPAPAGDKTASGLPAAAIVAH
jgi:hypothetical protein